MSTTKAAKVSLSAKDAGKEIIFREGEAPKIYDPQKVDITGSIFAPVEFIKKRKHLVKPEQIHVLFSKDEGKIQVFFDEDNHFRKTVTGQLKEHPLPKKFLINQTKTLPLKDLVTLLRFNKHFFKDESVHRRMVEFLMKFKADVEQVHNVADDQRGNKNNQFVQRVNVNHELSFTAKSPLFVGGKEIEFKVEIVCEVRTAAIEFWFESIEYQGLIEEHRESIVKSQIAELKDYVCIEQ